MAKKILVITGDNLGLRSDQLDYPDVETVQFPVVIGEREYRDTDETNAAWLVGKFVQEKTMAKSASISRGDLVEIVERRKKKFDLAVHVVMSSVLSSATYAVAEDVKASYSDQISILNIDSRQASAGVGCVLLRVLDALKESNSMEGLDETCKRIVKRTFSFFVLPDLGYLQRGGRIGKAKALIGSMMKIIPIVGLMGDDPDGQMVPLGRGRTFDQVNASIAQIIQDKLSELESPRVKTAVVTDTGADPRALEGIRRTLADSVECETVVIGSPSLVEAVHLGPGAYAVSVSLE